MQASDLPEAERARLVALVCKAEVKALLSLITPESDAESRAQVTAEMKRMLFSYLAPMFAE